MTKIERKLLQTMEMITMKKKKIAIAERDKRERARGRGDEGGGEEEEYILSIFYHYNLHISRHLVGQNPECSPVCA